MPYDWYSLTQLRFKKKSLWSHIVHLLRVTPSATGAPVQSGASARSSMPKKFYKYLSLWKSAPICKYANILQSSSARPRHFKLETSPAIDHDMQQDVRHSQGGRRLCQPWAGDPLLKKKTILWSFAYDLENVLCGITIIIIRSVTWRRETWMTWRQSRVQEASWITLARMRRTYHPSTARGHDAIRVLVFSILSPFFF